MSTQIAYERMQFGIARCGTVLERAVAPKSALVFFEVQAPSVPPEEYTLVDSQAPIEGGIAVYCEHTALDFLIKVQHAARRAHERCPTRGWFTLPEACMILPLGRFTEKGEILWTLESLSASEKEYVGYIFGTLPTTV